MELLKHYDWNSIEPDVHFILERDIDNCVTEKILRNKFHDPLVSSDSEDESKPKDTLNWDQIFSRNKIEKTFRRIVQGIHPVPPFPKLSALTSQQHYQCLKVLCSQYPDVMPGDFFPRPTKQDYRHFEDLKEVYLKEQKEFLEWARSLWSSNHCVRALRPKPMIESVYEAEFKVRASSLHSFPKTYSLAAQIALESPEQVCEIVHQKEIIRVSPTSLPQLQYPDMTKRISIMKLCPVPEPCNKHPCRFVLPTETSMTLLPMTEIHKELAQFALDNGATNIASENALKCLMQKDRHWSLPMSVCEAMTQEGETRHVLVLGSEFSLHRESAQMRTYKAFRRLLENTLIPPLEAMLSRKRVESEGTDDDAPNISTLNMDLSDEEDDNLYIDMVDMLNEIPGDDKKPETSAEIKTDTTEATYKSTSERHADSGNKINFYNCTCKDTIFERPPPRSYRRWRVRNKTTGDAHDIIVHLPHKARGHTGEVIIEPIPEYQIDLGASEQSPDAVRSLALALLLRRNASVLNVRIDSPSGDIVTTETMFGEALVEEQVAAAGRLAAALKQLGGLRPGRYLLHHEPIHGNNAMLYWSTSSSSSAHAGHTAHTGHTTYDAHAQQLSLGAGREPPPDGDEAKDLKAPPKLIPVLLPVHKYRRILPCAFTPYPNQLSRETKKPPNKQKPPPQAIRWPKRKSRNRKKKN